MNERDFALLKIMRDEANQVLSVASHPSSASKQDDKLLDDALSFSVRRLGVMAERVSPHGQALVPQIPWHKLIEISHQIIEQYRTFDVKAAWEMAQNTVSAVRAELERIIENTAIEDIETNVALPVEWDVVRERLGLSDDAIAEFCHKRAIQKLSLFGSVLRDDFRAASDVDVLVEFEPDKRLTIGDLVDAEMELGELLSRKVDYVETQSLNEHIRDKAIASARTLYERNSLV